MAESQCKDSELEARLSQASPVRTQSTTKPNFAGYVATWCPRVGRVGGGGLAILVGQDIPFHLLRLELFDGSLELQGVTLNTVSGLIDIINVYNPNQLFSLSELRHYLLQLNHTILFLGDFNAHSPLWDERSQTNPAGRALEGILDTFPVGIINDSPTFIDRRVRTTSTLDLFFATHNLVRTSEVRTGPDLGSDHFPVCCTLGVVPVRHPMGAAQHWKLGAADWTKWTSYLNAHTDQTHVGPCNAIMGNDFILAAINSAAEKSVPMSTGRTGISRATPWWDAACSKAVAQHRHAKGQLFHCPSQENLIGYKCLKVVAKRTILLKKRNSFAQYVGALTCSTPRASVWRCIRSISGRASRPNYPVRGPHATALEKTKIFSKHFRRHSLTTATMGSDESIRVNNTNYFETEESREVPCFTMEELNSSLSALKNKAPGQDTVYDRFLQKLPLHWKRELLCVYNTSLYIGCVPPGWKWGIWLAILKPGKDPEQVSSYRPICLLSCIDNVLPFKCDSDVLRIVGELQGDVSNTPVVEQLTGGEEEIINETNGHAVTDVLSAQSNLNIISSSLASVENVSPQVVEVPSFSLDGQVITQQCQKQRKKKSKEKIKRGQEMHCHVCDEVFTGRSDLLKHQKTMHPNVSSGTVKCKEDGCNFACFRVHQLVEHLTSTHQLEISEEQLEFSDEIELLSWKEDYEMQANCQYRLTSSKAKGNCRYYNCSRSGYYVRKEETEFSRRTKLKGTSKLNGHCVAGLIVRNMEDGKRHVMHTKTHYGHNLEKNHLRLSPSQRNFIRVLVESGLSVDEIVEKVSEKTSSEAKASHNVSRKDVVNVVSSFQTKKLGSNFSFCSPYSAWNVSNVALQLKGNIIFHKASGEQFREDPKMKLHDFVLCFMTQDQIEELSRERFSGLGVHLVIDPKSEDGLVIICVYACVQYIGKKTVDLPLAWCVSNANHDGILRAFFGSIKQKCGELNVQYLVSEKGFNIHGPWCETFSSFPINVTAPWSVQESISSALEQYVKSTYLRKNLHNSIRVLFSIKNIAEFKSKMYKFVRDGKVCPAYQKFMAEYFIPNFVEEEIPGFAAAHYASNFFEIMLYEEATSVLRQRMLHTCFKPLSKAVSDITKYIDSKQRNHVKMQCSLPRIGTTLVRERTNSVDKSKVDYVKCMLTNLIGMLDEGYLPSDYEEAHHRLDICEKLVEESCVPPLESSPEEKKCERVKKIPSRNKGNSRVAHSNQIRITNRGFSGTRKLEKTSCASRNRATGQRVNSKFASKLNNKVSGDDYEEINSEQFVLLEEVVQS
ncbi:Endonuclease/exonuclease/phosphatase [Trinorchestia longiramus]|nr:Endonuclease/exonuclease/phosphatase [Trinorchestia longiramus]